MRCQAITTATHGSDINTTRCNMSTESEFCYYHSKIADGVMQPSGSTVTVLDIEGNALWPSTSTKKQS